MSEPIRVLHFADIHVGMENYGKTDPETGLSSRVLDFLRRLDEMIQFAAKHDVDLVIFAGDAFKTRTPNPTYQREFAFRIMDLAELAHVVLLTGNHDLPPNPSRANSVEIFGTLRVDNVTVITDYSLHEISTKRGTVAVGAAPYPMRATLLQGDTVDSLSIADVDANMEDVLATKLEELATEADTKAMPRLLTGHFTVSGAVVGSERQIMLGRDVAVSLSSLADSRWDYVALGHIHKHQNLTANRSDSPPVVYSGSMERIDFGEEGDPKGFCWVELSRERTTWKFVPVKARPFVTLRKDLRQSDTPTQDLLDHLRDYHLKSAIVRVLVQLTEENLALFNEAEVRRALQEADCFSVAAIYKDIEQPARMRLGGSPEGLTPLELLERYLLSKEVSAERRERLLQTAEALILGDE